MGYHMHQVGSQFLIPAEKKADALIAVKALAGGGSCEDWQGGRVISRHYSWVRDSEYLAAQTLEEALDAWRWKLKADINGNVVGIEFEGEKAGDDETLFGAIAPFVLAGSFIEMVGEDGERWRWMFDGKNCEQREATITW